MIKHNPNWPQIVDHPYRVLVVESSEPGKTNELLNLIKQQGNDDHSVIDKTYLYDKDGNEAKYQYLT